MNAIRHNYPSLIHCLRAFPYWSLLSYFSVATVTITAILLLSLLPPLPLLPYYFATKNFAGILSLSGVVELTTQLLILENILWLPLCRINNFGLNTLPSKAIAVPYTCGLSVLGLCLNVSSFRITSSSRPLHCFSSRSYLRKLATIYASACCSSTSLPFPTHKLK